MCAACRRLVTISLINLCIHFTFCRLIQYTTPATMASFILVPLYRSTRRQLRLCTTVSSLWSAHPPIVQHVSQLVLPPRKYTDTQLLTQACLNVVATHGLRWYSRAATDHELGEVKHVYTAPLKGAVRAIKIFSLTTAITALFGAPVLVWFGNPTVPVAARIAISSLVVLAGISTTAILHWLVKGYIIKLHYAELSQTVGVDTLTIFACRKHQEFHISECGPPSQGIGFNTFRARGRSYFLHTEVFQDKKLLSALLGVHSILGNKRHGQQPKANFNDEST